MDWWGLGVRANGLIVDFKNDLTTSLFAKLVPEIAPKQENHFLLFFYWLQLIEINVYFTRFEGIYYK